MDLQLRILKVKTSRDFLTRRSFRFAIVDHEISGSYPANFVCVLPQHMNAVTADTSIFAKMFKDDRIEVARRLLSAALLTEVDPETRREILDRLRQLEPKPFGKLSSMLSAEGSK